MIDWQNFDRKKLFKSKLGKTLILGVGLIFLFIILIIALSGKKEVISTTNHVTNNIIPEGVISTQTLVDESIANQQDDLKKENEELKNQSSNIVSQLSDLANKVNQLSISFFAQLNHIKDELRQEFKKDLNLNRSQESYKKNNTAETFNLELEHKKRKTAKVYIPAGTYAKAVLLEGADVMTGKAGEENPKSLWARIEEKGSMPNGFESDLQGCRVRTGTTGIGSTQRGELRLEKLSCVNKDGEIIETDIIGHITSKNDGKIGVQGTMKFLGNEVLKNAGAAEVLSGIANTVSPKNQVASSVIMKEGGNPIVKENLKDKALEGLGNGIAQGMDGVADYHRGILQDIRPFIEMKPGANVVVVFDEGVYFGDTEIKKRAEKEREARNRGDGSNSFIQSMP